MHSDYDKFDPELDLLLERTVDVPRERVWAAWTQPEHLKKWFTPAPWKTVDCEIDLRPGGRFYTVMRSPEGQDFPNAGCYLEIVEFRKLVFTDALAPGFRPREASFFTAIISLESVGRGTRYTARALHKDTAGRIRHEQMGFHTGWGKALEQLVEVAQSL